MVPPRPLRSGDPERVARFALTARLGSGGMGIVYLGADDDTGQLVALKVIRSDFAAEPEFRARFRREIEAARAVGGACTARLVDADPDAEEPWMATELIPGQSLAETIATRGAMETPVVIALAAGLAEALTAIHGAGIVHRDLKPGNVILSGDGPKVIDFGIAAAVDATVATRTGVLLGSPGYMAPEQVTGHGEVGPAADVFAWGLTVLYAATGRPPFGTGRADALLYRVVHSEADTGDVPAELRPSVIAALVKEPAGRPSADDLLRGLIGPTDDPATGTRRLLREAWNPPPIDPAAYVHVPTLTPSPTSSRAGDRLRDGDFHDSQTLVGLPSPRPSVSFVAPVQRAPEPSRPTTRAARRLRGWAPGMFAGPTGTPAPADSPWQRPDPSPSALDARSSVPDVPSAPPDPSARPDGSPRPDASARSFGSVQSFGSARPDGSSRSDVFGEITRPPVPVTPGTSASPAGRRAGIGRRVGADERAAAGRAVDGSAPAHGDQDPAAAAEPTSGRGRGPGNAMTPWAPLGAPADRTERDPMAAAGTGLDLDSPGEDRAAAAAAADPWRRVPGSGVPDGSAAAVDAAPPAAAALGRGPNPADPGSPMSSAPMSSAPMPMPMPRAPMLPRCATEAGEPSSGGPAPAGAHSGGVGAENLMGAEAWEGSGPVARAAGPDRPGGPDERPGSGGTARAGLARLGAGRRARSSPPTPAGAASPPPGAVAGAVGYLPATDRADLPAQAPAPLGSDGSFVWRGPAGWEGSAGPELAAGQAHPGAAEPARGLAGRPGEGTSTAAPCPADAAGPPGPTGATQTARARTSAGAGAQADGSTANGAGAGGAGAGGAGGPVGPRPGARAAGRTAEQVWAAPQVGPAPGDGQGSPGATGRGTPVGQASALGSGEPADAGRREVALGREGREAAGGHEAAGEREAGEPDIAEGPGGTGESRGRAGQAARYPRRTAALAALAAAVAGLAALGAAHAADEPDHTPSRQPAVPRVIQVNPSGVPGPGAGLGLRSRSGPGRPASVPDGRSSPAAASSTTPSSRAPSSGAGSSGAGFPGAAFAGAGSPVVTALSAAQMVPLSAVPAFRGAIGQLAQGRQFGDFVAAHNTGVVFLEVLAPGQDNARAFFPGPDLGSDPLPNFTLFASCPAPGGGQKPGFGPGQGCTGTTYRLAGLTGGGASFDFAQGFYRLHGYFLVDVLPGVHQGLQTVNLHAVDARILPR
ncbi:Putative serine/threonine protein kinase [Frankia alni ACN14a]|uniref:non-specific serine/threonine protein kinase n=1 Tax=Frankia alni (strain DSM 45986 / CECT 9034 / ACN14a) TaxID=326424 RepID=Q0RNJ8_FRAAA|nr:Putative serine/threonine protein kinase [Frankia alni ACN14a]